MNFKLNTFYIDFTGVFYTLRKGEDKIEIINRPFSPHKIAREVIYISHLVEIYKPREITPLEIELYREYYDDIIKYITKPFEQNYNLCYNE